MNQSRKYIAAGVAATIAAGGVWLASMQSAPTPPHFGSLLIQDRYVDTTDASVCGMMPALERGLERLAGLPVWDDAGYPTLHVAEIRMHPSQAGRCMMHLRAADAIRVSQIITYCQTHDSGPCQRIVNFPAPTAPEAGTNIDPTWANEVDASVPDDFDGAAP